MNSLDTFWGCGKVFLRFRENKVDFQILKLEHLSEKVIPLFQSILRYKGISVIICKINLTAVIIIKKLELAVNNSIISSAGGGI